MSPIATLYAVLGLPPGVDRAALDEAYRRLMKIYHPDRAGGDHSRAAEINRAYAILKDPQKRARLEGWLPGPDARTWPVAMVDPQFPRPEQQPRRQSRRCRSWLLLGALLLAATAASFDPPPRERLERLLDQARSELLQLLDRSS